MTTRFHALTVVLESDIREDDAEGIIQAIRHIRGVADVTGEEVTPDLWTAQVRARDELGRKVLDVIYPERVAK
jgi:hypothetical protein